MRLLLLFCVVHSYIHAQQVYQVYFDVKDESKYSTKQPEVFLSAKSIERRKKWNISIDKTDIPVHQLYIDQLQVLGCEILTKTKWLNGVTVKVKSKEQIDSIRILSFVKSIQYLGQWKPVNKEKSEVKWGAVANRGDISKRNFDSSSYGKTYGQVAMLNVHKLHQLGYNGQGIDIAVIDAGFKNVNQIELFSHLFEQQQILHTFDFVQHHSEVFLDDDHGTAVLACMAGYMQYEYIGTAPNANYVLLRSEYASSEMPIEEYYWIEAIEYADSMGIDLVNSSLGYNEFDDKTQNHFYKELTGKEVAISKAADLAVAKGMVVVVSAGNEGDLEWRHICVPADAEKVITVAGVDEVRSYAAFSSIGPTADKRIKPDIAAQGDNVWVVSNKGIMYQGDGTSYAAPLAAGAIACIMQAHPKQTPTQIVNAIKLASSRYYKPDVYSGYGLPDLFLTHQLLQNDNSWQLIDARKLNDNKVHVCITSPVNQKGLFVIQDETGKLVLEDEVQLKAGWNRIPLKRSHHLSKGIYNLQFRSSLFSTRSTFNYH